MKIFLGLALFLSGLAKASNQNEDLKLIHQYKQSFCSPFFYPPDGNEIPNFHLLGDAGHAQNEKAIRLSTSFQGSNGAIWLKTPNTLKNWRINIPRKTFWR